jgi:hypothetical protein
MPRVLLFLALAALARPSAAQESLRIEGLQGRVETLGRSERVELLTGLGPRDCPGPGLLEAGSMASARLFWPTRASLLTQGRAGLEWHGGGEVFLRVFELQHGELEVRRGPLLLELPWDWHARFETGAYRLRSLPGGTLEIETVAGTAPQLWWSRAGLIRPCAGPACGERVLLPPGWSTTSRGAPETHAPWTQVSWPWGQAPETLRVTVEPAAPPVVQATAPLVEQTPAVETPPAPVLPPFDAQLWRGLAREQLELVGTFALEQRDDLALERSAHGGITLRLRSDATRPAWVLRASSDLELAPGTLVVLDERGTLLVNLGSIRSHVRPPGRPAPGAAGIAPRP